MRSGKPHIPHIQSLYSVLNCGEEHVDFTRTRSLFLPPSVFLATSLLCLTFFLAHACTQRFQKSVVLCTNYSSYQPSKFLGNVALRRRKKNHLLPLKELSGLLPGYEMRGYETFCLPLYVQW